MPMLMTHLGHWNLMFMGLAFLSDIQQSGPRGGDKLYSTNWFMASAEHRVGASGAFEAVLMLSLEPATITDRRYPLLFQTGETAYGRAPRRRPASAQLHHGPGLSLRPPARRSTTLDLYFAPVGDPALGPVAYPHRASAMEFPEAPLSHHWQDSTHIADDVVTVGIRTGNSSWRPAASTAPSRARIAGSSSRAGSIPGPRALVFSREQLGRAGLRRPAHASRSAGARATRSAPPRRSHIHTPVPGGSWSSSLIWGRIHSTANAAQPELVPGRIRPARDPPQFSHRPR